LKLPGRCTPPQDGFPNRPTDRLRNDRFFRSARTAKQETSGAFGCHRATKSCHA
jgi:hypothetical protein